MRVPHCFHFVFLLFGGFPCLCSKALPVWAAVLCLISLLAQNAGAWGDIGHMLINRAAAEKVPANMPQFLKQAAARIEYLGPEPDRWRNTTEASLKNAQEPDHFIDLERGSGMPPPPPRRDAFYR